MKRITSNSNMLSIFIGVIISFALMMLTTTVLTTLIHSEVLTNEKNLIIGYLTHFSASFVGLLVVGKLSKERILPLVCIGASIYTVIVLGIKVLVLNGGLQNYWMLLLSVLTGGVIACALCIRKGKRKYLRKKHI